MRLWRVSREVPRYEEWPLLLFANNNNTEITMNVVTLAFLNLFSRHLGMFSAGLVFAISQLLPAS